MPSPAELAAAAAAHGMQALALTDRHGLSGTVEFYDACRAAGVRPILGLTVDVAGPARLAGHAPAGSVALLAADLSGWRSLCRVSSALQNAPASQRTMTQEALGENSAGLICLTGGTRGPVAQALADGRPDDAAAALRLLDEFFPGRLYVELQIQSPKESDLAAGVAALAHRLSLPVVATNDTYYLDRGQASLQRLLTAIRLNRPLPDLPPEAPAPPGAWLAPEAEMRARFSGHPAAIAAAGDVADRCRLDLPLGVQHYPQIALPTGVSAAEALRQKARDGAARLYGELTPALEARLDHELSLIAERGYAPLFLIMEEIIGYARRTGVPFASRGSAASSLAAHCLGITTPDPIRLNLYFERFLNPARATPPDIDTDLCSRRRDGVIRHVYETYGAERVAMVCTVNRFRGRSALREAAKAHGLRPAEVSAMVSALPYRGWGPPSRGRESPYADLASRFRSPVQQRSLHDAASLLGLPRHLSIHPGGVVIAPGPLTDLVPTQLSSKGVVITQFDLDMVQRLGLVKIDLLGIRGLTVLGDVAEAAQPARPRRPGRALAFLEAIPEDDGATADLVRTGRTIGCFQIESPGMRATLREIDAATVDDIMAALALYRPGPLTGGLKEAFVRRHLGLEPVSHLHPALAPLLGDTYGVVLYQEQVLRIAHELAGLTLADSDLLRRAMSHFDPGQQMRTLQERFVAGAQARHGVPADVGERIWELMAAFAGYGFPKAHAASYAQVAWRAAWCKAHHPALFMAAVLANWGGYYSQRVYLTEARRLGLAIRPPHINCSRREFSVVYADGQPILYMGLDQVRDLTRRTQQRILRERPYESLPDFLDRVDPRPAEAENLVRAGALDGFGLIPALLRQMERHAQHGAQLTLFERDEVEGEQDWPLEQKVRAQEEVLGASVTAHPLELAADKIGAAEALTTVAAAGRVGQRVRVAGTRQTWRRTPAAGGGYVYFMSLEDLEGMIDVAIFGDVYRRNRAALAGRDPIVVEGVLQVEAARAEPILRAERVWKLE